MGLSASLFAGITGLNSHGEKMSVIGNNIANVNTVGFKASKMFFEDAPSQNISTSQGVSQVGRGVRISAVYGDFSQGSFETTNEATDLAIGGEGFFVVKNPEEDAEYYTRAGVFRFNEDGYLEDPNGNYLQGWAIENASSNTLAASQSATSSTTGPNIVGTPRDIQLENFQSSPQATSEITVTTNLNSQDTSNTDSSTGNPFLSLLEVWDGSEDQPISDAAYAYQTTIRAYDANGSAHDMSVYFDQVDVSNAGGQKYWEYMVTIDPDEDNRVTGSGQPFEGTSAAGIIMTGTMIMNAAGDLTNMSAFTLTSNSSGNLREGANWTQTSFSDEGFPLMGVNFLGVSNASFPGETNTQTIELNFGIRNTQRTWQGGVSNAGAVGNNVDNIPRFPPDAVNRSPLSTTSFASSSTTLFQAQDGFTAGFLQSLSVDRDGVLSGRYSNGQVTELYALTLATFNNEWGLEREGGNLFSETQESGPAITGLANTGGKGSVASNSLEQSNVDLASEMVQMITTQRGFQANSKVITTTDSMLGELIQLKR